MSTPGSVLTQGLGAWGTPGLVLTLGFDSGSAPPPSTLAFDPNYLIATMRGGTTIAREANDFTLARRRENWTVQS